MRRIPSFPDVVVGLALSLGAAAPLAAQQVHMVNFGGGADFTWLQDAVDAAADGDVILVHSTDFDTLAFTPTLIDGKSLTVIGDAQPAPVVGPLLVRNVPAGNTVTLRHLRSGTLNELSPAVRLVDNTGTVWLEDVSGSGAPSEPLFPAPAATGLLVTDCASVVVTRCTFIGGFGLSSNPPFEVANAGGRGLSCVDSFLSATGSSFLGGQGGSGSGRTGGKPGGHGLETSGSLVYLSGCTVAGGTNGSSCSTCIGSDGLHLTTGELNHLASNFIAGITFSGTAGQAIDAPADTVTDLLDVARRLSISAPVRSFDAGTIAYDGAAGDLVGVQLALGTGFLPLPGKKQVYDLAAPAIGPLLLGVADGAGKLQFGFTAPDLLPAAEGLTLSLQSIVQDVALQIRLSGPTAAVLVDDSF